MGVRRRKLIPHETRKDTKNDAPGIRKCDYLFLFIIPAMAQVPANPQCGKGKQS